MTLFSPTAVPYGRANELAQSAVPQQMIPHTTTNQSTGKLIFRKSAIPLHADAESKNSSKQIKRSVAG